MGVAASSDHNLPAKIYNVIGMITRKKRELCVNVNYLGKFLL